MGEKNIQGQIYRGESNTPPYLKKNPIKYVEQNCFVALDRTYLPKFASTKRSGKLYTFNSDQVPIWATSILPIWSYAP